MRMRWRVRMCVFVKIYIYIGLQSHTSLFIVCCHSAYIHYKHISKLLNAIRSFIQVCVGRLFLYAFVNIIVNNEQNNPHV